MLVGLKDMTEEHQNCLMSYALFNITQDLTSLEKKALKHQS